MDSIKSVFLLLILFGCADAVDTERDLLGAEFDFALALVDKLAADTSCIVSPLSISLALALVHSGTKGTSRQQIEQVLLNGAENEEFSQHFSDIIGNISKIEDGVEFQLANRAFVRNSYILLDSYLSSIRGYYKADAISLDFTDGSGSAKAVNSFVSNVTHGKIENIVRPEMFTAALRMILVNAVYMKAEWANKFDKHGTHEGNFFVKEDEDKKVDYMSQRNVERDYYENDLFQLLSLKYEDTRYRFNIILPKQRFELEKLQTQLLGTNIGDILSSQLRNTLVNIKLPKFKLESDVELGEVLQSLGIKGIFAGGEDLNGFAETNDLAVSSVIHKAIIEVDEDGTVAAAATAIFMVKSSMVIFKSEPINFIADHPFMFCITFNNHPIFIGKYY